LCCRCRSRPTCCPLSRRSKPRKKIRRRIRLCCRKELECLCYVCTFPPLHLKVGLIYGFYRLQQRKDREWGDKVQLFFGDMRSLDIPELVDILISELLGSFGDNELSPECLDGAQKFLKRTSPSLLTRTQIHTLDLTQQREYQFLHPTLHISPLCLHQNSTTKHALPSPQSQ
jgi:hypothetical protein